MQQLISSNTVGMIDDTPLSQLSPQLSPIRLRAKGNSPINNADYDALSLLGSSNQKDDDYQGNEIFNRRSSFQISSSNIDDNLGRYIPRSKSSNDDTKKLMFIKKDNGEMIPIPMQTQLNDVRTASRLGRRIIQPISSLSSSASIYFSDNNTNPNTNDNKTQ
jgi:hypothetical protein